MGITAILDTSVVIDLLRGAEPALVWFGDFRRGQAAITPVVWMEIVQGARNKPERQKVLRFLHRFHIEHPTPDDNRWAMRQLAAFHLSHGIEFPDVMIASVAVRLDVPLYTFNLKHYEPLPGLDARAPY